MGKKEVNVIVALILIVIGVAGIMKQVFHINLFGYISVWDLGILALGLYFEWQYFNTRRNPGLLVAGGLLSVVGLFEFLQALFGGYFFSHFPAGQIGLALGLLQFYWFGKRNQWLLIPIAILLLSALEDISAGFFSWFNGSLIWPIGLVVLGVYLLLGRDKKSDKF